MQYSTARICGKSPMPTPTKLELALRSLPFYGGTTPGSTVPAATAPPGGEAPQVETDPNTPDGSTSTDTGGGSSASAETPPEIAQLLTQVTDLQKKLDEANGNLKGYKDKEDQAKREALTREQQLESDLQQRDAIIAQMDNVIRNSAITNAMLSVDGVQWHDVSLAIAKLNPESFDVDVNLEDGTASVTGIKEEAQRIAKELPWMVKSNVTEDNPNGAGGSRTPPAKRGGSGAPPAPPGGGGEKAAKRNRLISKYPVLAAGQPIAGR